MTTVDDLGSRLAGTALRADDPGYDAARVCFNALVDRRPGVIVRCLGPADVATAFDFARANDLEVAVRGGGHNPAGHCVLDGGLVIDLSRMRRVEVDPGAQVARAGGGSTWLDFDGATQAHGLVTPGGIVGSTGVCGLARGGGIGHLTAQLGLTCDNLVGAELVTPDGSVVRASAEENEELLWGLRGAGGNFGVATRLDFRLHPLETVVGGRLVFSGAEAARDALRRFRDVAAAGPRDLSCQAVVTFDETLAPAVVVAPCYTGPSGDPEELRRLRAGPGLVEDGLRAHSFLDQQRLFDSAYGENRHYWKGHFVHELPDELIDELVERVAAPGRPVGDVLVESLHGAPKAAAATSTTCRRTSRSSASARRSAARRSSACRRSRSATTRRTSSAATRTSRPPPGVGSCNDTSVRAGAGAPRHLRGDGHIFCGPGDSATASVHDGRARGILEGAC